MAGTAAISSSFVITFVPSSTVATTITNPGRTFKVVGVMCNNTTGAALTLNLTGGGNALVVGAFDCAANVSTWCELTSTDAHLDLAATDNLVATVEATGLTPIEIHCVATGGGQALTAAD